MLQGQNLRGAEKTRLTRSVHIVVPFYKNEALVSPLVRSLLAMSAELARHNATVFLYNDSPGYRPLADRLLADTYSADLPIEIVNSETNLGFIGTANRGLQRAADEGADALLLNSDTVLFPGALDAIRDVASSDEMIGFVSPRSNNATICTLPHSANDEPDLSPLEAYERYARVAAYLPAKTYVPTAVGFCLLIKWIVLTNFGYFDPAYGVGYNEENDLIMRANRAGYRAALANHGFVWHRGNVSISRAAKATGDTTNTVLLNSRYPEYPRLVQNYFHSAEYLAEGLLEAVASDPARAIKIGFDLSDFGAYHNGTMEAGRQILAAAASTWSKKRYSILAYASKEVWDFHHLGQIQGLSRADPNDPLAIVAAVVRIGQPFSRDALPRALVRGPIFCVFMLDTIAMDCGYLASGFDIMLWRFVTDWADAILTNSEFSTQQLKSRFDVSPQVSIRTSLHSLDLGEYGSPGPLSSSGSIFIVGNHFAHKAMNATVKTIAEAFPSEPIVALGGESNLDLNNVRAVKTGGLVAEEVERLYADARVVVFPSYYEGFGFPILHALARERPVFCRDLPFAREIKERVAHGENIHLFQNTEYLIAQLRDVTRTSWQTSGLPPRGADGWERSAEELREEIEGAIERFDFGRLRKRLQNMQAIFAETTPSFDGSVVHLARLAYRGLRARTKRFLQRNFPGALTAIHRARLRARSGLQ